MENNEYSFGPVTAAFLAAVLAIVVFIIVGSWKINEKAKKPGWATLIPIYGTIVKLQIVGKPWWWIFPLFGPAMLVIYLQDFEFLAALSFFMLIWFCHLLSRSFGKNDDFTAGLVLFPFLFIPRLGMSNAQYIGPYGDKKRFEESEAHLPSEFDFEDNKFSDRRQNM